MHVVAVVPAGTTVRVFTAARSGSVPYESRKQFIPDQPLYRLQLDDNESEDVLRHLTLKSLADDEQLTASSQPGSSSRSQWKLILNRLRYLASAGDPEHQPVRRGRRLCITAYAGVGKSIALEQLVIARSHFCPEQTVLQYRFEDLPEKADHFLSVDAPGSLISQALASISAACGQQLAPIARMPAAGQLRIWLEGIARGGRLTLAIDALDETPAELGKILAKSLADFLVRYPRVHCIVAGRPYAICEDFWHPLFAARSGSRKSDWEFCRTGSLTRGQMERFLGGECLRQLAPLLASTPDSLSNTRILDVLRTLEFETLNSLRSVADVYWYSIQRAMQWDKTKPGQNPRTKLKIDDIVAIYSALAFTSLQGHTHQQNKRSRGTSAAGDRTDRTTLKFNRNSRKIIFARISRALDLPTQNDGTISELAENRMNELRELSLHWVEFRYVLWDEVEILRWSNATYRDFFAALWLTRYADDNELQWLQERQHSEEIQQVWQFICGMPEAGFCDADPDGKRWTDIMRGLFAFPDSTRGKPRRGKRWTDIIRSLFTFPDSARGKPRPTAFMALAWPLLLKHAGFLEKPDWNDADLQLATYQAQQTAARATMKSAQGSESGLHSACGQILRQFLGEYPVLKSGRNSAGEQTPDAAICAEDLESQFRDCESFPGRTFYAGDGKSWQSGPATEMSLEAGFQLCSVPVTRRLYALFDPRHADQHADYDKYSPEPRCPAIYLSYWDSVMFSVWAHGRLPTEWEWEYASRGGQDRAGKKQPTWWWGNDESQLVKYAWVSDNSGICTHPVGNKAANDFGLHDMLGNVWEWTSSRYDVTDSTSVSRVDRGGSFLGAAINARCSSRGVVDPSYSNDYTGCRVARAEIRKP